MKDQTNWRPISSEEAAVIRSILSQADIRRSGPLIADLDGALVANETTWILDVKVANNNEGADLPNGPFPVQAFVPKLVVRYSYRGRYARPVTTPPAVQSPFASNAFISEGRLP